MPYEVVTCLSVEQAQRFLNEREAAGWTFVTVYPPNSNSYSMPSLIFHRAEGR